MRADFEEEEQDVRNKSRSTRMERVETRYDCGKNCEQGGQDRKGHELGTCRG